MGGLIWYIYSILSGKEDWPLQLQYPGCWELSSPGSPPCWGNCRHSCPTQRRTWKRHLNPLHLPVPFFRFVTEQLLFCYLYHHKQKQYWCILLEKDTQTDWQQDKVTARINTDWQQDKITARIKLGICQNNFNIIINLDLSVPGHLNWKVTRLRFGVFKIWKV